LKLVLDQTTDNEKLTSNLMPTISKYFKGNEVHKKELCLSIMNKKNDILLDVMSPNVQHILSIDCGLEGKNAN